MTILNLIILTVFLTDIFTRLACFADVFLHIFQGRPSAIVITEILQQNEEQNKELRHVMTSWIFSALSGHTKCADLCVISKKFTHQIFREHVHTLQHSFWGPFKR